MKGRLYPVLAGNGLTLKAWFTGEAAVYVEHSSQGQLFLRSDSESESESDSIMSSPDVSA